MSNFLLQAYEEGKGFHAMPIGVLAFLIFVPVFWLLPRKRIRAGIIATSILLTLLAWQPLWCLIMAGFIALAYVLIRVCHRLANSGANREMGMAASESTSSAQGSVGAGRKTAAVIAWVVLLAWYFGTMFWARTSLFPGSDALRSDWYGWVNAMGPGYMMIRLIHLVLDVSSGKIATVRFIDFLTYALFAPTFRMGPVIRYQEFIPQLDTWRDRISAKNVLMGLVRIATGLLRLGLLLGIAQLCITNEGWKHPETLTRGWVLVTTMGVAFTLYLWTSGYSDVAIGLGRMIGFVIPENFTGPWLSGSLREYWKRYHNTMSSVLFEYIYIPMGGSRKHVLANYYITFLFCGLWHSPTWNQPLWAASQALGLYINRRWHLFWTAQAEVNTSTYQTLRRYHLAGGRLSFVLAWALTTLYQAFTFSLLLEPIYPLKRWVGFLLWS